MGFHTFDAEKAGNLEDEQRYRWCSREELLTLVAPNEETTVADLGSGTGFYTDVVAPHADTVYAVDVQSEMHEYYEEKGRPANVRPLNASVEDMPLDDDGLDAAFSTMTYHEFSGADSMAELARVLRPGGRLVTVDWSADGSETAGPPLGERHDLGHAVSALTEAGFTVDHAVSRTETFVCRARR
ncbi:Methyltransferase domain-containing protein [Halovenus aranensis]|jgi:ubiquinone/menaquinone biosynthesis C-methylase UbiE|uniref:Methyltransferase domain-containing protein n=1 Tax=Halovenus aranensis TaxID=890420 RepID=A0A1G8ZI91_9EURY|nr:class I SAM-dependent methyltransferase [Halovenus aranensis]SDK14826.1 Methyltransferase domain-containing protein [Halovenus aranensis]